MSYKYRAARKENKIYQSSDLLNELCRHSLICTRNASGGCKICQEGSCKYDKHGPSTQDGLCKWCGALTRLNTTLAPNQLTKKIPDLVWQRVIIPMFTKLELEKIRGTCTQLNDYWSHFLQQNTIQVPNDARTINEGFVLAKALNKLRVYYRERPLKIILSGGKHVVMTPLGPSNSNTFLKWYVDIPHHNMSIIGASTGERTTIYGYFQVKSKNSINLQNLTFDTKPLKSMCTWEDTPTGPFWKQLIPETDTTRAAFAKYRRPVQTEEVPAFGTPIEILPDANSKHPGGTFLSETKETKWNQKKSKKKYILKLPNGKTTTQLMEHCQWGGSVSNYQNRVISGVRVMGDEDTGEIASANFLDCVFQNCDQCFCVGAGANVTATRCEFDGNNNGPDVTNSHYWDESNGKYGASNAHHHVATGTFTDCTFHNSGNYGLTASGGGVIHLYGEATAIHTNLYCGLSAGEGGIINIHLPLIHNTSHDNICEDDEPQRFCDYSICEMGFINNIDQNNNMILKRTNKSSEDIIESPPYFRLKACSQTSVLGL